MGDIGGGLIYTDFEGIPPSSSEMDEPVGIFEARNCSDEDFYLRQNETGWCNNYTLYNETYYEDVEMYSLGFKVVIAILYNSVFVTALLGNALVCYVVFSSPRMRTVTNYLIANLAVGDLLMAVLCVPFSYIPVLLQYWPFGHFLCYLLCPAQAISVFVSSYTLVALAADRYMAILYPLRPRLRRSQACWVIAVVWLIAIITATPIAIFTEYYQYPQSTGLYYCEESGWKRMGVEDFKLPYGLTLMILQYFFPLIVLIFTYSRIAMAVWGKKSLGEAEDSRDQRLAKTKRKMIKMMLTVVIVYTMSWLPFNMFLVYGDLWSYNLYVENRDIASHLYPVIHFLAIAHTVWNPCIYCYMNARFRDGFRAAISNVPCMWKLLHFCHWRTGGRARASSTGHLTDIGRRRSYCSTNRLNRTNTTCTTYTFGSGSLHNLHNTTAANYHHPHNHHVIQQHNPMMQRKLSNMLPRTATGNGRSSVGSITIVSQFPRGNHLSHHMSVPLSPSPPDKYQRERNGVKNSSTMTSLAPAISSSPLQSSPSSESMVNLQMASLLPGKGMNIDLNTTKGHHHRQISPKSDNGHGNGVFQHSNSPSPSFVTINSIGGKDQVVTTTGGGGGVGNGSNGRFFSNNAPPSILSQKRTSISSAVSESFM